MQKIVKLLSLLFLFISAGCSLFQSSISPDSLYFRLGNAEGTQRIVDNFMVEILLDRRLNTSFINLASDKNALTRFKKHIFDHICNQGGGDCAPPVPIPQGDKERVELDQEQVDIYLDKFTTILYDSRISGIDREFLVQKTAPLLTSLVDIRK
jgi:hypothetical protein